MQNQTDIKKEVAYFYWKEDINCATTMLRVLSKHFSINLQPHVMDAAVGLHGAGGFGAQCGLVEGGLIFIGIYGKDSCLSNSQIVKHCYAYAKAFEAHFKSLSCKTLRPQGFHPTNPPHLCESLTINAIEFTIDFLHTHIFKNNTRYKEKILTPTGQSK